MSLCGIPGKDIEFHSSFGGFGDCNVNIELLLFYDNITILVMCNKSSYYPNLELWTCSFP